MMKLVLRAVSNWLQDLFFMACVIVLGILIKIFLGDDEHWRADR